MICHIVKPKIYLPNDFFDTYSQVEQKYMLLHEYVHLYRHDLRWNTAMLMLACINWFNPVMWFAYSYFRTAQELACDDAITQNITHHEKKIYGHAILKTALKANHQASMITCTWNTGNQIKERCLMLSFHTKTTSKTLLGTFIFIASACAAIAAPGIGGYTNNTFPNVFSADHIESVPDGTGIVLNGHVNISIGNKIQIAANKAFAEYSDQHKHDIKNYIIYGKGTLKDDGKNTVQFVNGYVEPSQLKISAEGIQTI